MNTFEQAIFALLTDAETIVPIFIHSPKAVVALNVSEELLSAVLQKVQQQKPTPAANPSTPVVPATS